MSHYEQRARSPSAQQPEWLYFSTMVLHSLTKDIERGGYCHTIQNLRRRAEPGTFKGIAFVTFENGHCTAYVYHASNGTMRYADGLGAAPTEPALQLVRFFLTGLAFPLPVDCANAGVVLQGEFALCSFGMERD